MPDHLDDDHFDFERVVLLYRHLREISKAYERFVTWFNWSPVLRKDLSYLLLT
jgi:hypothetical protein